MPLRDRLAHARQPQRAALDDDFARIRPPRRENGLQEFGTARADQSREHDDLAWMNLEGDVVELARAERGPWFRGAGPLRTRFLGPPLAPPRHFASGDQRHDRLAVEVRSGKCPHGAAVAQHGNAVDQAGDLVEPVADVDDADLFFGQLADKLEKPLGFALAQGGGGLVEDQQTRVATKRLGDFHELAMPGPESDTIVAVENGAPRCRATPGPGGASRASRSSRAGPAARCRGTCFRQR